jgi:hypothetical protein
MRRKLRRWTAYAMIIAAMAATPMVSGCHGTIRPPKVFRVASYSVLVVPLDPPVLSDFKR